MRKIFNQLAALLLALSIGVPVSAQVVNSQFIQSGTGAVTRSYLDKARDFVSIKDFGGVGDGVTLNDAAFAKWVAVCKTTGAACYLPAGTYAHSDVLTIDSATVYSNGDATFKATVPSASAVILTGTNPRLLRVSTISPNAASRSSSDNADGITVTNATNFELFRVKVDKTAAAGILVRGSTGGRITGAHVINTYADGIHITGAASDIVIDDPIVENTGDDAIAVVSYQTDSAQAARITVNNPRVSGGAARGLSNVGGVDVVFNGGYVSNTAAAGAYVAEESSYNTFAPQRTRILGTRFKNCATSNTIQHQAVLVYSSGAAIDGVDMFDIDIEGAPDNKESIGVTSGTAGAVLTNVRIKRVKFKNVQGLLKLYKVNADVEFDGARAVGVNDAAFVLDTVTGRAKIRDALIKDGFKASTLYRLIDANASPSMTEFIVNDVRYESGTYTGAFTFFGGDFSIPRSVRTMIRNFNDGVPFNDLPTIKKSGSAYVIDNFQNTSMLDRTTQLDVLSTETVTFTVSPKNHMRVELYAVRKADQNQWKLLDQRWNYVLSGTGTGTSGVDWVATGANSFQRTDILNAGNGTVFSVAMTYDSTAQLVTVTITPSADMNISIKVRGVYKAG